MLRIVYATIALICCVVTAQAHAYHIVRQAGPATGLTAGDRISSLPDCPASPDGERFSAPSGILNGGAWFFNSDGSQAFAYGVREECSHLNGFGDQGWEVDTPEYCTFISGPNNGANGYLDYDPSTGFDCLIDEPGDACEEAGHPSYSELVPNDNIYSATGQSLQDILIQNGVDPGSVTACVWVLPLDEQCTPVSQLSGSDGPLYCQEFSSRCNADGGEIAFERNSDTHRAVCITQSIPDQVNEHTPDPEAGIEDYNTECLRSGGVLTYANGTMTCSGEMTPYNVNDSSPDLDGDGIPDFSDTDIDNDGTLNWADDDIDGDGIPNTSDPTPMGPQAGGTPVLDTDGDGTPDSQDDNSYAYGGGNCSAVPACGGDAIHCAIFRQNWRTTCETRDQGQTLHNIEEALAGEASEVTYRANQTEDPFADSDGDGTSDAATTYYNTIQAAPIVQALSNFGANITVSGQCPSPSFNAFGETFTMDGHCALYADIAPMLSALMLVIWGIIGFRIVVSA